MRALCDGELNPDDLQELQDAISTTPCSTAECRCDFDVMNIIAPYLRSSLTVANINRPPLSP